MASVPGSGSGEQVASSGVGARTTRTNRHPERAPSPLRWSVAATLELAGRSRVRGPAGLRHYGVLHRASCVWPLPVFLRLAARRRQPLRRAQQLYVGRRAATFHQILANEGVYLLGVPFWTVLPIAIAVFLSKRVLGAGVVRAIIFMPAVVSPVLLGVMFTPLLSPTGLVNETLSKLGLGFLDRAWLSNPQLVKPTIIVVLAWSSVGLGVAVFTAGLTGIPSELIDAALVAGASSWQRLVHVILPGLRKPVAPWAVYNALSVFLWLFGFIYALTQGGPGDSSSSIDYDVYSNAVTNNYGVGRPRQCTCWPSSS